MKKKVFIKNAAILTATALILRVIGMWFRIYLSDKIGPEGIGLYQMIFSVYMLAATFASSGISTAVTITISGELVTGTRRSVIAVLKKAVVLTLVAGIASALLIFFFASPISNLFIRDARAVPALKILAFSLPFMGISSCLKGYFVARRKVSVSSNAQIFEQLIRVALTVFLLFHFADKGITVCCFAVLLGDTVAEALSCLYMYIGYLLSKRSLEDSQNPKKSDGVMRRLIHIALPITAGRYLNSLLRTAENMMIPGCLGRHTGSKEQALGQFGLLKGMALPILLFPSSFLTALSILLIPEISEIKALGDQAKINRTVNRAVEITLVLSVLIGGIFMLYGNEIALLLYKNAEVGFLIRALAPLVPLMYLESVIDGILKGLDQQMSSFRYNVIDSVVRIALIFLIVPARGIEGFLFVMVISNVLTCTLNLFRLLKVTGAKINWKRCVLFPVLSAASSGGAAFCIGRLMNSWNGLLYTLVSAAIMCLLYLIALHLLSGFSFHKIVNK